MPKKDKTKTKSQDAEPVIAIDPKLLTALICPKTRGPLTYDRDANELVSKKAKLAYPIREGVPIMLIEEARKIGA